MAKVKTSALANLLAGAKAAAKAAAIKSINLTPVGDEVRSCVILNPEVEELKYRTCTITYRDGSVLTNQKVSFNTPRGVKRILPSQLGVGKGTIIEGKTFYVWGMI